MPGICTVIMSFGVVELVILNVSFPSSCCPNWYLSFDNWIVTFDIFIALVSFWAVALNDISTENRNTVTANRNSINGKSLIPPLFMVLKRNYNYIKMLVSFKQNGYILLSKIFVV